MGDLIQKRRKREGGCLLFLCITGLLITLPAIFALLVSGQPLGNGRFWFIYGE